VNLKPGFFARVFPAFVVAAGLALLAGCTVKEDATVIRLRFSLWGTVAQQKIEEAIVREFAQQHPEIQVELLVIGFLRYDEKLNAMMVGDIAPDVMLVNLAQYDNWASRGVLADLTNDSLELGRELTLLPGPRAAFARDGRFYALPVNAHGLVTFVNLDAFAAANIPVPPEGFTWKQIEELAPRLSRRAGATSALTDYALLPPYYSYPVLVGLGGSFFDDPYHPQRAVIASAAGEAWVDWLRRLEGSRFTANRAVATDAGTYQLFRDGRVALHFSGRWQIPEFESTAFRWDIRPFPAGPRGSTTWHGGTAIGVSATSRHLQAARLFARFYAGRSGAEIAMRGGRTVPVYRELAESPSFLDLRPPVSPQHFVATMEAGAAVSWLYAPGSQDVWEIVNRRIEEALGDRSLPAAEVTRRMAADLTRWLEHQRRHGKLPAA
jgi:multiple sugar transport system substrate-binding protein